VRPVRQGTGNGVVWRSLGPWLQRYTKRHLKGAPSVVPGTKGKVYLYQFNDYTWISRGRLWSGLEETQNKCKDHNMFLLAITRYSLQLYPVIIPCVDSVKENEAMFIRGGSVPCRNNVFYNKLFDVGFNYWTK
jgi:hypothetical protein